MPRWMRRTEVWGRHMNCKKKVLIVVGELGIRKGALLVKLKNIASYAL